MITPADFTEGARNLRFVDASHQYFAGVSELTGTTEVLKGVGVSLNFESLVEKKQLTAAQLGEAREKGKAAHAATHFYDEGTLRPESVDPRIEPYLESWIGFRRATGFKPALLETALWHPGLLLAGTIDRAGMFEGFEDCDPRDLYTVDIKLGDPEDAGAQWQTAAYATMLSLSIAQRSPWYSSLLGMRPRYSVRLLETGKPGKLHRYDNTLQDWAEYQAFLVTFRRQHARRRQVAHA